MPGVGFAMGDVVIGLVIEKYGHMPALRSAPARVLVALFSPELTGESIRAAMRLREAGLPVEIYPEPAKMAKQIRYADSLGIPFAVVIGPDEAAQGRLAVKELATGVQTVMTIEEAIARLKG